MTSRDGLDVIDQLRGLGETAQDLVEPVTATEILLERAPGAHQRRSRRVLFAGAVAAALVLVGLWFGATALLRSDEEPEVITVVSPPDGSQPEAAAEPEPVEAQTPAPPGELSPLAARAAWEDLRQCESAGDYRTLSGNGLYGAYQFDVETWQTVTSEPYSLLLPSEAPAIVQDEAAMLLYARRGAQPWPICGHFLSGVPTSSATSPVVTAWLVEQVVPTAIVVFAAVDATQVDLDRLESILLDSPAVRDADFPDNIVYVDKEEAFEEFKELFEDSEEIVANVISEMLPTSFRVQLNPDTTEQQYLSLLEQLRSDPKLRQVTRGPRFDSWETSAKEMMLQVERFGGSREFRQVRTVETAFDVGLPLLTGMADLVGYRLEGDRLVIAGHGVDPSDVFLHLGDLAPDDLVTLSVAGHVMSSPMIVDEGLQSTWVVTSSTIVDIEDAPLPPQGSLALTTEGPEVGTRLVVTAERVQFPAGDAIAVGG